MDISNRDASKPFPPPQKPLTGQVEQNPTRKAIFGTVFALLNLITSTTRPAFIVAFYLESG